MTCENSLILIMDGNFVRVGDKVLSPHMAYEQFAARFTDSFDDVQIVARSFPGTQAIGDSVTGERTSFIDLGANRGKTTMSAGACGRPRSVKSDRA